MAQENTIKIGVSWKRRTSKKSRNQEGIVAFENGPLLAFESGAAMLHNIRAPFLNATGAKTGGGFLEGWGGKNSVLLEGEMVFVFDKVKKAHEDIQHKEIGAPKTPPFEILYVGLFAVFRREKRPQT